MSTRVPRRAARGLVATIGLLVMSAAILAAVPSAQAATATLRPTSLTTTSGSTGGQPVSALKFRDQRGNADRWSKYVELEGRYTGYATLPVPDAVRPSSVTGLQVRVSYRGPGTRTQAWTWKLYDWRTSTWVTVGTNADAPDWGAWKLLTFQAGPGASAYVSPTHGVRVQMSSSNAADAADIDYLAVVLTTGAAPDPTPTTPPITPPTTPPTGPPVVTPPPVTPPPAGQPVLPPVNGQFDYQIGAPYPPASSVAIVDRDRTASPVSGRYNICYVNAFQTQPGESGQWPSSVLLRDARGALVEDAGWPGEYILDTRTAAQRTAVMGVLRPWLQDCRNRGFAAVEPDNLDSYSRSEGLMTRADNVAMATLLTREAHAMGLAVAQKNDTEIAPVGRSQIGFDFAIVEECQRWSECDVFTRVYGDQVYELEYAEEGGLPNFQAACAARGDRISVTYRDRDVVAPGSRGYVYRSC